MAYTGAVFGFEHNWADPVIERLSWLTNVLPHRDSSEQRYQARLHPRRQLECNVLPVTSLELSRLENFFRRYQHEQILLPIWTDNQTLTAPANSGQADIAINTATYDFDAGAYVILWRDYNNYEAVEINSLTSSTITAAESLTRTWPVGTQVIPARLAWFGPSARGTHYGPCARPWRFQFDIEDSSLSINRLAALSPQSYVGVDTYYGDFTTSGEPQDFAYEHPLLIVDGQSGARFRDAGSRINTIGTLSYERVMTSRAEISEWLAFLARRNGQRVPFYFSLGENDFPDFIINPTLTNNTITYTSTGFAELFSAQGVSADVVFTALRPQPGAIPTGQQHYHRIIAATDNGDGTETLTIQGSIHGNVINFLPIFGLSLARFGRLASDVQELAWLTGCAARTAGAFREVYEVPA